MMTVHTEDSLLRRIRPEPLQHYGNIFCYGFSFLSKSEHDIRPEIGASEGSRGRVLYLSSIPSHFVRENRPTRSNQSISAQALPTLLQSRDITPSTALARTHHIVPSRLSLTTPAFACTPLYCRASSIHCLGFGIAVGYGVSDFPTSPLISSTDGF